MPQLNVQNTVAKWKRNLTNSQQTIKDGVMAVQESPTLAAARAQERYVQGVQQAVQSGKWQRGLRSVTLDQWQQKTVNVGIPRLAAGVNAATDKMTAFMTQLLPYTANVSRTVRAMPKNTLQDSIARAQRAIEMMAQFKGRQIEVLPMPNG